MGALCWLSGPRIFTGPSRTCATASLAARHRQVRALLRRAARCKVNPKHYVALRVRVRRDYVHRLVMSTLMGRPLRTDEHVHHVDGDKHNNRPDNLQLLSAGEHSWRTNIRLEFLRACAWCGGPFRPVHRHQGCCCVKCGAQVRVRRKRSARSNGGRKLAVPGGGVHEPHKSALVVGTVHSSIPQRRD